MVEAHESERMIGHAVWAVYFREGKDRALQAIDVLWQHHMDALARLLASNLRFL